MIKDVLRVLLVGGVVVSSLACAARRPVLSPNAQLEAVGAAAAQQDIDDCLQKAAAAGYTAHPAGKAAGTTAVGAAAGAAVGAAGGGTGGLIRGIFSPRGLNPDQRQSVDQCLKEKGYEVTGWQ
jgi:hypothetical protein